MVILIGFIGLMLLGNGADEVDKAGHHGSAIVQIAVGGVMLLAALIGWLMGRDD